MKNELVQKSYEIAKERYAALGVDVDSRWNERFDCQSLEIPSNSRTIIR